MPVLKYQRSRERLRNSKSSRRATQLLYLSLGLLSLLLVMSLTGCATSSQKLRECPKPTPIGNVIDVSAWQSDTKKLSTELTELLNSVQKTTDSGTAQRPVKPWTLLFDGFDHGSNCWPKNSVINKSISYICCSTIEWE